MTALAAFATAFPIQLQADISAITLEDIDVKLRKARLNTRDVRDPKVTKVLVNGQPVTPPSP